MSNLRLAVYAALLAFAVAYGWLRPLCASLWLDETVSYWIASPPLAEMFWRNIEFQFGSLYHWLLWPLAQLEGGPREVLLRTPSLLAVAGASAFVYRIAACLFDREAGAIAAITFALQPMVVHAAYQARPYGLALLFVTAAMHFHLRWHLELAAASDQGTSLAKGGLPGVALASVAAYVHPILGLVLLVLAVDVLRMLFVRQIEIRDGVILFFAALACLVLLPFSASGLIAKRSLLSWAPPPRLGDVFRVVALPLMLFGFIVWRAGWARSRAASRAARGLMEAPPRELSRSALSLMLLWCLLTPVLLLTASITTSSQLFVERYYVGMAPGLAVLMAAALRQLVSPVRLIAMFGLVGYASFVSIGHEATYPDWRARAELLRWLEIDEETPVLFHTGLIEAEQMEWLEDPHLRRYIESPRSTYPFPGRIILLPRTPATAQARDYLEHVYQRDLAHAPRFVLAGRFPGAFFAWLENRATGFEFRRIGDIFVFDRRTASDER